MKQTKRVNFEVLVEDATSLRETAFEFIENEISGKAYLDFCKGYPGPYGAEARKLFSGGVKKARRRLKGWLTRHYGKDW